MKKAFFAALLIAVSLALCCGSLADGSVLRGYSVDDGYVYLSLGSYPSEADGTRAPVLWRVLDVSEEKALILSEKILDVQQVIFCDNKKDSDARKFRKISSFTESDLFVWMNGPMLDDLCSEQDFHSLLVEGELGFLYPLTEEQLLNPDYGFSKTRWVDDSKRLACRQFFATEYAKEHELYEGYTTPAMNKLCVDGKWGSSSAWGANVKNPKDVKLTLIGVNGHLSYGVYTRVNIGVLPAMTLDTSLLRIVGGTGSAEDPFLLDF